MKHDWIVSFVVPSLEVKDKLSRFFRSKKNYECINHTYDYFNLNTGVNFSFSYSTKDHIMSLSISLKTSNSNTIREAINEINTLTKKFHLKITYPDNKFFDEDFVVSRFIQKWREIKTDYLNFYYDTIGFPIASNQIKSAWYWNYSCQWTERFLKKIFKVEKIQFFNKYGKAHTIVDINLNQWSAIPVADYYRLSYTKGRNFFRLGSEKIVKVVSFKEFEAILQQCRFLPFEKTPFFKFRPEDFKAKLKVLLSSEDTYKISLIDPSKIIDKEIFDNNKIKLLEESTY